MEIRRLTAADAAAFWALRLEALETEPLAFGEAAAEHRDTTVSEVARRLAAGGNESFVVGGFENGRLLATAGFWRDQKKKRRHKGHVWGVYVAAPARGRGVGRAVLSDLLDQVRAGGGVEQVLLSVAVKQRAARELYRSLGFEVFGVEPEGLRVGQEAVDEEYMVLRLS